MDYKKAQNQNKESWNNMANTWFGTTALPNYGCYIETEEKLHLFPELNSKRVLDIGCGFCVIIMIVANSLVNKRVSELLPNFETTKIYGLCAA